MSSVKLMIFSILVAVVAISNGENTTECRREDGIIYHGNTIDSKTVEGEEDCANWCGRFSECRYWSLYKSNNYCRLKTSDSGRSDYSGWVSGTKGCESECRRDDGIYYYNGNNIDGKRVEGEEDCANWCGRIKECRYWTLGKSSNYCRLKTSDSGRSDSSDAVSGTKGCAKATACKNDTLATKKCGCGLTNCGVGQMCVDGTKCLYPACARDAITTENCGCGSTNCGVGQMCVGGTKCEYPGKDDDSSEDEPFCVAVDCSLPNAENLCPIKCSLQKDREFCGAVGCSHSNSQTFCPIKCSGVTNLDDVLAEIRGVQTQIEQLKTTLLYHVYGNH